MAKREFIDRNADDLRCELFTYTRYTGIDEMPYEDATKAIDQATTFTEQDIVKPYLTEILEELNRMGGRNLFKDDSEYSRLFDFIDNLLFEDGEEDGKA